MVNMGKYYFLYLKKLLPLIISEY